MKTIKWLKITAIVQVFYALLCAAALIWVGLSDSIHALCFQIGEGLFFYGGLLPIAPILLCVTLFTYSKERGIPDERERIGRKWIWAIVQCLTTALIWTICGGIFVALTGGV